MEIHCISIATCTVLTGAIGGNVVRIQAPQPSSSDALWQPWSAEKVAKLNAEGRPVFVDFTAAWCVTCQYNEKTTLSDPAVLAAFRSKHVALLRADWTRHDAEITAALGRLGRSGVPVYAIHLPGRPPLVLTEILSSGALRSTLDQIQTVSP
jgi:thiol:disulfide interchange protein